MCSQCYEVRVRVRVRVSVSVLNLGLLINHLSIMTLHRVRIRNFGLSGWWCFIGGLF